jgi:multimeric flavodoxin WrbA
VPQVYIVYESPAGNTARMAKGVAEGTREVEGMEVALHRVAEAKAEDLADADAIIGLPLGTPRCLQR